MKFILVLSLALAVLLSIVNAHELENESQVRNVRAIEASNYEDNKDVFARLRRELFERSYDNDEEINGRSRRAPTVEDPTVDHLSEEVKSFVYYVSGKTLLGGALFLLRLHVAYLVRVLPFLIIENIKSLLNRYD